MRIERTILTISIVGLASISSIAKATERECLGNIETYDKQLIQAGVKYKIWYQVSGEAATVRVAGREFQAKVEHSTVWQGAWIRYNDDREYLSFYPEDGGTLKLQFDFDHWFSGNCL